jgi:hypothetical protein
MNDPSQTPRPRFLDSDLAAVCQRIVDAAQRMTYEHGYIPDDLEDALDAAAELGITPTRGRRR